MVGMLTRIASTAIAIGMKCHRLSPIIMNTLNIQPFFKYSFGSMMSSQNRPLEPSADEMRFFTRRVLDLLIDSIEGLECSPASGKTLGPACLDEVSRPPTDGPGELAELLEIIRRAAE